MSGNESVPASRQAIPRHAVTASQLVGVWTLVSYTNQQEGIEDTQPFGPAPEGFLIYTADGFVSAQLMKPGRSHFKSNEWNRGTPEEYREAGVGYIAYCGRYEIDEENGSVTHVPSVALLPNLIGGTQSRFVTLIGDRLTLRAVNTLASTGGNVVARLEWQRHRQT